MSHGLRWFWPSVKTGQIRLDLNVICFTIVLAFLKTGQIRLDLNVTCFTMLLAFLKTGQIRLDLNVTYIHLPPNAIYIYIYRLAWPGWAEKVEKVGMGWRGSAARGWPGLASLSWAGLDACAWIN